MSNTEVAPQETLCESDAGRVGVEILVPRKVPLGGPRAMDVRRTLPQRQRSLIGAWCFLDHYGPDRVGESGGMQVPRHPHTGLQTVSWLFTGEIEHRDSAGFHAAVRPGEVNLMTAGRGISHSEFSTPGTDILHGAQLWVALPDRARQMEPTFEHYRPDPLTGPGWIMRVFLGSIAGATSPVTTHTALLGAEILMDAGSTLRLDTDPSFEHGLLVDTGAPILDGHAVAKDHLAYLPVGRTSVTLEAGVEPLRVLLIGGEPLGEQIVMWWNFVGRSHEEIVAYRAQWQAEIGVEKPPVAVVTDAAAPRFGSFPAGEPAPLPAPALPNARLRPRD
ncbi:redox-sensitive bicupin YhaK (pirin superfamily) [Arthrobacter ginsengisoli]|uniref:Redox-sensitive bicupin YhaK (Pirin superfamily) n=1 Tax=Arthrobacter ginsengisoli TaxID=1356565 RepID=A0ABU1UC64_9MICC|nr:pirin family protein [Arthrobacter ginsengisoli]MDR7082797.1 redox-sensitive bicupin YhaK (pirin superfamily) [Arthrobacter ginsengisoli]